VSIATRMSKHPGVFRENNAIMFCNYCNYSVEWRVKSMVDDYLFPDFNLLKVLLLKVKELFTNSSTYKGYYLNHLQVHRINNPCKTPLPNKTCQNSWFKIVFYTKDYIKYWASFYLEKYERDTSYDLIAEINTILQDR
ncbi:5051_t:CDS:2, partial [Dentiscutata heterogama]